MSPRLSNVLPSGTTTESSNLELLAAIAIAHEDMAIPETRGRQTQHMSNDAEVDCSSTKDKTISNFSIKVTSASETGIAADAEKEQHQCNQYSKTLQSSMNLEQHTGSVHVAEPRKKDQDCKNTFKNEKSIDVHSKNKGSVHKKKTYMCEQCGYIFSCSSHLNRHINNMHVIGPHKECPVCRKTFKNKQYFDSHYQNEHGSHKKYKCDQCSRLLRYPSDLKRHKINVHATGPREKCLDCGNTFKNKKSLHAHRRNQHSGCKNTHKCDQCNKTFSIATNLQQHIKTVHTTGPDKECPDCKQKFKNKKSLASHRRNKHNDRKKKYICDECGKEFQTCYNLKRHIKVIHIAKLEQCKENSNFEKNINKKQRIS